MALIRRNHFAVPFDDQGSLMDAHRLEWLKADPNLPSGSRLTYPRCSTPKCVKPAHGDPVALTDPGDGRTRGIITAVTPTQRTVDGQPVWSATIEATGDKRAALDLTPETLAMLGFAGAVDTLECEVLIDASEHEVKIEPVPADDPDRPGGRPEWHHSTTISIARATGACPCGSRRPFAECHGNIPRAIAA